MRAKDFLIEASNLSVSELRKVRGGRPRYELFLQKVASKSPFTTIDGQPFVVDPAQYPELKSFFENPSAGGTLMLSGIDDTSISSSKLKKTPEFTGGVADDQEIPQSKEELPAKPSQVFQTKDVKELDPNAANAAKQVLDAGAFYANELYSKIATSSALKNAGNFGQVVIDLASQINQGSLPSLKDVNPSYVAAIRDYAGEYLGVLATMNGLADFPNQDKFYNFLGADNLGDLIIYFPKATNNPLADSIAVQHKATNQVINISSKGGKKGAPPSFDNLKVPDEFRKKRSFKEVVGFFDAAQQSTAKDQPFKIMNYLHSIGAKLPKEYNNILPLSDADISFLTQLMNPKFAPPAQNDAIFQKMPKNWKPFLAKLPGSNATIGGQIHYAMNKDIISLMKRDDTIPNFRKLVLEILGYNFIQLFTDIKGKDKKMQVRVLWPAKLDGNVELYSKAYAADPGKGKLSFSIT